MDELIEKLEKATGPDRELDLSIADVFGFKQTIVNLSACPPLFPKADKFKGIWRDGSKTACPKYTLSIDAALTLTDLILLQLSDIGADGLPFAVLGDPSPTPTREYIGIASSKAKAICIAALRARKQTNA